MAFIKATTRRHQASTRSDSINVVTRQRRLIPTFHREKRARVDMLTPNNNRGVTNQTDEKHLPNLREYFVGVVILACFALNTRLLLRVFNNNLLK